MMVGWGLTEALCYLRHLELLGEAERRRTASAERLAQAEQEPARLGPGAPVGFSYAHRGRSRPRSAQRRPIDHTSAR